MVALRERAPTHPGKILYFEYMVPYGLRSKDLSKELNVSPKRIDNIIQGIRNITPDTAIRLALYFNTTQLFWMNLQNQYDLSKTLADHADAIYAQITTYAEKRLKRDELSIPSSCHTVQLTCTGVLEKSVSAIKRLSVTGVRLRNAHAVINQLVEQQSATCAIPSDVDMKRLIEDLATMNIEAVLDASAE